MLIGGRRMVPLPKGIPKLEVQHSQATTSEFEEYKDFDFELVCVYFFCRRRMTSYTITRNEHFPHTVHHPQPLFSCYMV